MISIGEYVEIEFEKGGECVVTCRGQVVGQVQSVKIDLTPDTTVKECVIWKSDDNVMGALQLDLAAELVREEFSVIWDTHKNKKVTDTFYGNGNAPQLIWGHPNNSIFGKNYV